jgi:hypothetical protein
MTAGWRLSVLRHCRYGCWAPRVHGTVHGRIRVVVIRPKWRGGRPRIAALLDDVRGVLPRHQAFFMTSDSGPVHDHTGRSHRQDFGLATLAGDDLPVIGLDSAFVHGQFTDHRDWTVADRPRIALAVRTVDRGTGQPVCVVQMHGLRDPLGKADTPARRRQADRLADLVRRVRGPEDLVVVCGDFNVLPDSETFTVLADLGLTDLVGAADTRRRDGCGSLPVHPVTDHPAQEVVRFLATLGGVVVSARLLGPLADAQGLDGQLAPPDVQFVGDVAAGTAFGGQFVLGEQVM